MNTAVAEAPTKAITIPDLNSGEKYLGAIIKADGTGHHIIQLPGEKEDITWKDAKAWAESIGGTLPDRVEQALMFRDHKPDYKTGDPYWSGVEVAGLESFAWYQTFLNGYQLNWRKDHEFRAVAVRRLPIQ